MDYAYKLVSFLAYMSAHQVWNWTIKVKLKFSTHFRESFRERVSLHFHLTMIKQQGSLTTPTPSFLNYSTAELAVISVNILFLSISFHIFPHD